MKKLLTVGILTLAALLFMFACEQEEFPIYETSVVESNDFISITPNVFEEEELELRSQSELDSLYALLAEIQSQIDALESAASTAGTFQVAASKFARDLSVYDGEFINWIKLGFAGSSYTGDIPLDSDPFLFGVLVQKYVGEFLALNTDIVDPAVHALTTDFFVDGLDFSYNLFVHVADTPLDKLPGMYLAFDLDGDDTTDLRINLSWYVNKFYISNFGDDNIATVKFLLERANVLESVIFNNSNCSEENAVELAEIVLTKSAGRSTYWNRTNLPLDYIDKFKDAGWERVGVSNP